MENTGMGLSLGRLEIRIPSHRVRVREAPGYLPRAGSLAANFYGWRSQPG